MALEKISRALGSIRAEVQGWASTKYAEAIGVAAVGLYVEELLTSFFAKALKLQKPWQETLVKEVGRIFMSGLYYAALRGWNSLVAITASAGPLLMVGADLINMVVGAKPEELGESLALKALGGWTQQVSTASYVTYQTPAKQEVVTANLPVGF